MALTTQVQPIDKDIDLLINQDLSADAQSEALASFAREQLKEGEQQNQSVLGRIPPHKTVVDGTEGGSEDGVKPSGTILYEFEILSDIFVFIADQLKLHAPVGSGRDPHPGLYRSSFTFFADWVEVDVGGVIPANADEYIFLSTVPYARKIEGDPSRAPQSKQAPEGVFQAVAHLAQARFGNQAKISFAYRSPQGRTLLQGKAGNRSDDRTPAISVKLR